MTKLNRRKFLKAAAAGTGLYLGSGQGPLVRRPAALAAPAEAGLSVGAIFIVLNGGLSRCRRIAPVTPVLS